MVIACCCLVIVLGCVKAVARGDAAWRGSQRSSFASLDPDEAQRLVKIARTTRDRVRLRRAGMALASMQGRSVPEIAEMFAAKEETVA